MIARWTVLAFLSLFTLLAAATIAFVHWATPVRAINDPSRW
jgi:hypothetical protein